MIHPQFWFVIQLVLKTLWHPFRNRLLDNDSQFMNYDKPQYVYIYIYQEQYNEPSFINIHQLCLMAPIKIHKIVHDIRIWWVKSHRTPKAWGWNSIQQPPSPNLASFLDLLEIMVESPSKSKKWVWVKIGYRKIITYMLIYDVYIWCLHNLENLRKSVIPSAKILTPHGELPASPTSSPTSPGEIWLNHVKPC